MTFEQQPLGKIILSEVGLEDKAKEARQSRTSHGTPKVRKERHDEEARKRLRERDRNKKARKNN